MRAYCRFAIADPGHYRLMVFVGTHGRVAPYHANPQDDDPDRIPQFVDELISLVLLPLHRPRP